MALKLKSFYTQCVTVNNWFFVVKWWAELNRRICWQSFGLQNKSVSSLLSTMLTLTSKEFTDGLDFSCVNFKLGWKLYRLFRNPSSVSSPSVQMKETSMYFNHNHVLTVFDSRKTFSILSINKRNLLNDFSIKFSYFN